MKMDNKMSMALSLLMGLLGALVGSMLFIDRPVSAEVRFPTYTTAEEFRLVDAHGKLRAVLALSADEEPYLALLDRNENRKLWLGLSKESGLAIRDTDGKTRLVLSLDGDGEPTLVFRDRQQNTRSLSASQQEPQP